MSVALESRLKNTAVRKGAKAWGIADLSGCASAGAAPSLEIGSFSRAIVVGLRLNDAVLERIVDRPTPLYFHHYRQVNWRLDRLALELADQIQDAGHASLAIPASQVIGRDPMRGHVSHRMLGQAAGLGHLGRSTLLVHPRYGARMRYVSVLTDAPLPADAPREGGCGDCRACLEACPAGAIQDARTEFDGAACYATLNEFARIPYVGQHICGVCVRACPGRRGPEETGNRDRGE